MPQLEEPFSIYTNAMQTGFTAYDVRLKIMEVGEQPGQYRVHGIVTMTPAHAKILSEVLQGTIRNYEERFGEIDVSKIKEAERQAQEQAQAVPQSTPGQ